MDTKSSSSLLPPASYEARSIDDLWTCRVCGGEMTRTSKHHIMCSHCRGRLHPAPRVEDLPLAWRAVSRGRYTRFFWIYNHPGLWHYVPHVHGKALNQRPKAETVVAKVYLKNGSVQARVFRQAQPRKHGA